VTVERKEGRCVLGPDRSIRILDLPGAYSLAATSLDEAITRDVCYGRLAGEARPDLIICVVDATNLRLHLRFALELRQLGLPMIVALNMMDAAARRGIRIDIEKLEQALGMPVVQTIAVKRDGAAELLQMLRGAMPDAPAPLPDGADLHVEVRNILAGAVMIPRRTAAIDDALDRWAPAPGVGIGVAGRDYVPDVSGRIFMGCAIHGCR